MPTYDRGVRKDIGPDEAVSITSAREALSDDIARRSNRYLWQMSTRVVCFVGAALLDHWTRWILVAGAVLLPYVAVVLANAGQERQAGSLSPFETPQLPAGTAHTDRPGPLGPVPAAGPPGGPAPADPPTREVP